MSEHRRARISFVCGLWVVLFALPVCILLGVMAHAQEEQNGQEPGVSDSNVPPTYSPPASSRRGSFVVAPLPISSPALGTGIVPIFGYIFPFRKDDHVSPPSVVGMAGIVTNNGSRGFAAYADLYMKEKTYRITAAYLRGNLNYDLYGIGVAAGNAGLKLPLEQSGEAFRSEVLRRVGWEFFFGPPLYDRKLGHCSAVNRQRCRWADSTS